MPRVVLARPTDGPRTPQSPHKADVVGLGGENKSYVDTEDKNKITYKAQVG